MPIEIFGPAGSRARRAFWTAEECGADYVQVPLAMSRGEHRTDEYAKINPNLRVPAMRDGDVVLFESAAIARHIARRHPDAGLLPEPGSAADGLCDQWCFWVCTELEQPLWSMGKHRFALPEEHRIAAMEQTAIFEWQRAVPVLEAALREHEHLVGDRFGVADILAGHTLNWARSFRVPFESPSLEAYLDRLIARPAFERTLTLA